MYQNEFALCIRSMSLWESIDIKFTVSPTKKKNSFWTKQNNPKRKMLIMNTLKSMSIFFQTCEIFSWRNWQSERFSKKSWRQNSSNAKTCHKISLFKFFQFLDLKLKPNVKKWFQTNQWSCFDRSIAMSVLNSRIEQTPKLWCKDILSTFLQFPLQSWLISSKRSVMSIF